MGNILLNIPFAPKATWSRALIDDSKRGAFSAKCEITSLVSGMLFTMIMGRVIDSLESKGRTEDAFIVCGITLFVLTALHALCLILIKEKAHEKTDDHTPLGKRLKDAIGDRSTLTLIPVFILWNTALYITTPFFGTYQINELGFTMTAVSVMTVAYSLIRSVVSIPLGTLGDRKSFVVSTTISLSAMALGLVINSFGGAICHVIYYILYAVTLAGMNSGQMNLIFDYVEPQRRTGAIAVLYTIGGLIGFISTLIIKPLVDTVQANGNRFLFIENVYAQQILSVLSALLTVATLIYVNTCVKRLTKAKYL
jgi:Na+/melibiose symporter-like transporter